MAAFPSKARASEITPLCGKKTESKKAHSPHSSAELFAKTVVRPSLYHHKEAFNVFMISGWKNINQKQQQQILFLLESVWH